MLLGLFQGLYVFYLELVTDLLHIFVYMVFFLIIMKYYGFPLHLVGLSHLSLLAVPYSYLNVTIQVSDSNK